MTVLDLDFVPAHHRHRVHEPLRLCCFLPLLFFSCRPVLSSAQHFGEPNLERLSELLRETLFSLLRQKNRELPFAPLRSALVVASILSFLFTASSAESAPGSRESSITSHPFPLFRESSPQISCYHPSHRPQITSLSSLSFLLNAFACKRLLLSQSLREP